MRSASLISWTTRVVFAQDLKTCSDAPGGCYLASIPSGPTWERET